MRKKVLTVTAIVSGIYVAALWVITSHAAGTEVVTQPLDNLKTLVIAVIGAVGLIILAKNIMEFAQAYQNQDSSSMIAALILAMLASRLEMISPVLSFLGF